MYRLTTILILFLTLISMQSFSQESYKRTAGLTTSFTQGDLGIQVPIFVTQSISLAPYVSIKTISDAGSDFGVGLIPKFYINNSKLSPYFGLKFALAFYSPPAGSLAKSTTDILGGMAFGGDYFFDPRFAIGVEGQINVAVSDEYSSRFNNPGGSNLNTAMAINVSIFFGK
ncbi:MAG: hypothetical protein IPN61_02210 [Bacteroidetes bacterium]|nr:hypothetical protein [Bacteroidota bacterium]